MYQSFKAGEAVTDPNVHTIAAGLAPPMAGEMKLHFRFPHTSKNLVQLSHAYVHTNARYCKTMWSIQKRKKIGTKCQ